MKWGLLTYHRTTNFGSLLQTYGLYRMVQILGHECEIIDYRNDLVEQREFVKPIYTSRTLSQLKGHLLYDRVKYKKIENLRHYLTEKMRVSKVVYSTHNFSEINDRYDHFLVGSDLVWDFSINGSDTAFMLKLIDDTKSKVAYASSAGSIWNEGNCETVRNCLNRFDAIGVREKGICDYLNNQLERKVDFVCDPTMLLTSEEWHAQAGKRMIKEDYILCYMSDAKRQMYLDAITYGKKQGLKVYLIAYDWVPEGLTPIRPTKVEEFLSLIKHANTVFSASYHGLLFSLYFHKNVYYYNRGWKERMNSLAEYLDITDREQWIEGKEYKELNYQELDKKIAEFRESSIELLKGYLMSEKKV